MVEVSAGIIHRENKILITRRAAHKSLGGYWEFPGGKIEPGETIEACLKREIWEELHIDISVDGFFMENAHAYDHLTILLKVFHCTYLSGDIQLVDHDQAAWIHPSDLNQYTFAPADVPVVEVLQKKMMSP